MSHCLIVKLKMDANSCAHLDCPALCRSGIVVIGEVAASWKETDRPASPGTRQTWQVVAVTTLSSKTTEDCVCILTFMTVQEGGNYCADKLLFQNNLQIAVILTLNILMDNKMGTRCLWSHSVSFKMDRKREPLVEYDHLDSVTSGISVSPVSPSHQPAVSGGKGMSPSSSS